MFRQSYKNQLCGIIYQIATINLANPKIALHWGFFYPLQGLWMKTCSKISLSREWWILNRNYYEKLTDDYENYENDDPIEQNIDPKSILLSLDSGGQMGFRNFLRVFTRSICSCRGLVIALLILLILQVLLNFFLIFLMLAIKCPMLFKWTL